MDPSKAYKSFHKYRQTINIFLLLLLFSQLLVLYISIKGIRVPSSILKTFITLPNDCKISFKDVNFKFPNRIQTEKIEVNLSKKLQVHVNNLTLVQGTYIPNSLESFSTLKAEMIKCNFIKSNHSIILSNVTVNVKRNHLNISLFIDTGKTLIKTKGRIKLSAILSNPERSNFNLDSLLTKIESFSNLIQKNLLDINPTNKVELLCVFEINENINFSLIQIDSSDTNSLISGLKTIGTFDLTNSKMYRISTQIENLRIPLPNTNIELEGTKIFLSKINSNSKDSRLHHFAKFNTNSIIFDGILNGSTSNLSISLNSYEDNSCLTIILDNNSSNCSNFLKLNSKDTAFSIVGFNNFVPDLLDFKIIKNNKKFDLFTGDLIKFDMNSFSNIDDSDFKNYISFYGNNVSVLDAPYGNYFGTGTLDENLNLTFKDVYGKMGHSSVQGKYSQEWSPYNYNFILNGQCNPTDINNWMGEWWSEIWTNFDFNVDNVPYGDFIISGAWGDESNHSTRGEINASNFKYKELGLTNSNIDINVDPKQTSLSFNLLEHSKGRIKGHVKIPRKAYHSELLNYKMIGDFPLNDGKKIFGNVVESFLDDFNLTSLIVETHGDVDIWSNNNNFPTTTDDDFHIFTHTDQNGSWNGIGFSNFNGIIKKEANSLTVDYPVIKSCSGNISLLIDSNLSNKFSNIDLKFSNLKAKELFDSFISYQSKTKKVPLSDKNSTSISKNGIVDFNIKATCTNFDFTSLNGTGKIKVKDKELSKIRLLGILSNGLDELPIPLPSGTLKFNTLEGLFEIENGIVTFDRLVLSGLLSKVLSSGNINLESGELNIKSKIQLIGNVPIISKIVQIADPLAVFAEIKITGPWNDPKWEFLINPIK
ncbi:MAG: AsmA-like C-terminal region-containing protein [Opitutales bacterium]|nr:AsmA-like C-terminal region-containing protein [Opitutales bacterium]